MVAAGYDALSKIDEGKTVAVINSHEIVTGDFTRNPDLNFPGQGMQGQIAGAVGADRATFIVHAGAGLSEGRDSGFC